MAMIRINLCPPEELENPYWWAIDAAVLILVFSISYALVTTHLDGIRDEIADHQQKTQAARDHQQQLQSELKRVAEMRNRKSDLESRTASVKRITTSKITRFLPIILVEHIQNLKPDGVWLSQLELNLGAKTNNQGNDGAHGMRLKGRSLNNIILAEFMTHVKATRNQEADPGDLRTRAFFETLDIKFVEGDVKEEGDDPLTQAVDFEVKMAFKEREANAAVNKEISSILDSYRRKHLMRQ